MFISYHGQPLFELIKEKDFMAHTAEELVKIRYPKASKAEQVKILKQYKDAEKDKTKEKDAD